MNENSIKFIKLSDYGNNFGPRVLGMQIKEEVVKFIDENPQGTVVFDFYGVNYVSTGFSKELFGELWGLLRENFNKKIKFKFYDNKEIISSAITKSINSIERS